MEMFTVKPGNDMDEFYEAIENMIQGPLPRGKQRPGLYNNIGGVDYRNIIFEGCIQIDTKGDWSVAQWHAYQLTAVLLPSSCGFPLNC